MLHDDVKKAVDSGDINTLKYIFSTCLDGNPTFNKYMEDYEYCKSKGILFVPHINLHPMNVDSVDEKYWVQLQKDFRENPSIERLDHMREVAKILYKDRIRVASESVSKSQVSPKPTTPVAPSHKPVSQPYTAPINRNEQSKTGSQENKGYSTPNTSEGDNIIRKSERVVAPEPTSRPQQGTQPKKASGVGYFVLLACLIVAIIAVAMICTNK